MIVARASVSKACCGLGLVGFLQHAPSTKSPNLQRWVWSYLEINYLQMIKIKSDSGGWPQSSITDDLIKRGLIRTQRKTCARGNALWKWRQRLSDNLKAKRHQGPPISQQNLRQGHHEDPRGKRSGWYPDPSLLMCRGRQRQWCSSPRTQCHPSLPFRRDVVAWSDTGTPTQFTG